LKGKKTAFLTAAADLTSLLDVIFILLFLVMSQNGGLAAKAESDLADLRAQLEGDRQTMQEAVDRASAAQGLLDGYDILNNQAVIVSITVENDANTDDRHLILSTRSGTETIYLRWEAMESARRQLDLSLARYAQGAGGLPVFFSFEYDPGKIYRRDYDLITDALEAVRSVRSDVYLKFTEKEVQ